MNTNESSETYPSKLGQEFLIKARTRIELQKKLAERAIAQVQQDSKLNYCIDNESNSIAIIIHHLSGNIISRWTDFFTSDGEKTNRNRPQEFERSFTPSRKELMEIWDHGWDVFFKALDSLKPEDLLKIVYVRKEPLSVLDAILRQLTHYSSHIGQILFLAKHLEWENWKHVTLERNAEIFDVKDIKK